MKNASLIFFGLLAVVQGRTIITNAVYKPRVVNGEEAKLGEIPYQVALLYSGRLICGGSILNEYWIVTAGHCFEGDSHPSVQIAAGSIDLREPYSVHQAVKLIVHEQMNPSDSYRNDIALMKGSKPDILQKATVYITDPKVCKATMAKEGIKIHPTQVCANDPTIRRGECTLDSGGPVTVDGVLTGVVSWSIKSDGGCGSPIYPGVHTRVSEYIDWIEEHIN